MYSFCSEVVLVHDWSSTPTLLLPLLHLLHLLHHLHLLHQREQEVMMRLRSCPDSMMFSSLISPMTSSTPGGSSLLQRPVKSHRPCHGLRRLRFCSDSIFLVSSAWPMYSSWCGSRIGPGVP